MPTPHFSIHPPEGVETPVVVEVPHAGTAVDPSSAAYLLASARSIARDADLYADELYSGAPRLGATLIVSHLSRFVCDLNRSEEDVDAGCVVGARPGRAPHGLIWRAATDGSPAIVNPVPREELERRLQCFHRPYHAAVRKLLLDKRERFGFAVLVCAHSMPSSGPGVGAPLRADVVPGSLGRTTAASELIRVPDELARERGYTVLHDHPYRGGYSTRHYGRPADRIHAVQVELNRRLYMDEVWLTRRDEGFTRLRAYCDELIGRVGELSFKS